MKFLASQRFLHFYKLRTGCYLVAFIFSGYSGMTLLMSYRQVRAMSLMSDMLIRYPWYHAYTYGVVATMYYLVALMANLTFFIGISKRDKDIVRAWILVACLFILQNFITLSSLSYLYSTRVTKSLSVPSLVYVILVNGVLLWGLQIGFSFWLELKKEAGGQVSEVNNVQAYVSDSDKTKRYN